MEFNKNWTKEDNKELLNFIKDGKSVNEIREHFGNNKLFYHPNKKYYLSGKSSTIPTFKSKIDDYSYFMNEIKYEELKTDFQVDFKKSKHFNKKFDYIYKFQTDSGNRYIIDFIYLKDTIGYYKNRDIYNVSFTLEKNRNLLNSENYEELTFLKEQHELIKRIIFIFKDFNDKFAENCVYLIGETVDKRKTKWYRNLIKDSFSNIKEIIDISSFTNGMTAYYYEVDSK